MTSRLLMPTVAISTAPLWRLPLAEAFAAIKGAGAEAVEILVTQDTDTQDALAIERLAERNDLPVVAIHAPLLVLTRRVFTTDPLVKIRRTLELTKALDVGTIVLHPPYVWQLKYSLWLLHELEDAIAGTGTAITMENMYPVQVGSRSVGFQRFQGLRALERFPYVTLDTSHLAVSGRDIVESYRRIADRVVHVHLSDNRGKGRDSHAPLGKGILPIVDFVEALDPGTLRSIALEINPGAAADDRGKLEELLGSSLDLVRSHLPKVSYSRPPWRRPDTC